MESLKTALLFYSHLNQLDNDFLEDHNYSREEIVSGVRDVLNRYHLDSLSALSSKILDYVSKYFLHPGIHALSSRQSVFQY